MKPLFFSAAVALLSVVLIPGAAHADDTIKRVQQSLRDQGFYYGAVDGAPGDEMTQAIRRYQIRNGLQVSGQLNDETRAAILRGGGGGTATAAPSATPRPRSTPGVASTPRPAPAPRADYGDEGGFHRNGNAPANPPVSRPAPGRTAPDLDDEDGGSSRTAPPRQPAPDGARPDLRVAPGQGNRPGPAGDPRAVPPNGVAPSASLTALFESTPYEFAPPPVQENVLRRAQSKLLRQGFYDREPDGRLNGLTAEALTNFQAFNRLRRTGRLDTATLAAMRLLPGDRPRGTFRDEGFGDTGPRRGPAGVYEGRVVQ